MDLKSLRESQKMSAERLASLLGITRQSVLNYESGFRKPPIDVLKKYAEVFGISIDSLVGGSFSIEELKPLEVAKPKLLTPKDEMEQQLLERFRSLTFDNKLKAISYITTLTK